MQFLKPHNKLPLRHSPLQQKDKKQWSMGSRPLCVQESRKWYKKNDKKSKKRIGILGRYSIIS